MSTIHFIGEKVTIEIDRPLGSKHPTHGFVYKVNYGFVPGVYAPDREYLDAYVLGIAEPINQFEGECIAIIHRLNDNDDKLIIVPIGVNYTNEQIRTATNFQEQFFQSVIVRSACYLQTNSIYALPVLETFLPK